MEYRREIDGIRTLAVVPVVIYHLRIPFGGSYLLPGGFLGVDIFFVLSGFLITKIILDEMARTGRFSLGQFYVRRARRILPALFLVIFASVIAGIFILTPSEMTRLTASAFSAVLFFSNGYWLFELEGYGRPLGLLQPLLHTWSLAVEEQFYLLFPLALLVIKPSRWPLFAAIIIAVLLVASLITAELTTAWLQPLSFYSPLSRAWEMLAGALLALTITNFPKAALPAPILRAVLPKLSLVVITVSMVVIDLDSVAHPGVVTVPVVLATVALLWSAGGTEIMTRLLSTKPFVAIGLLSYSIYLWHFPVFAYGRLLTAERLGVDDIAIWMVLTLFLSVSGYYLVERPFRYKIGQRVVILAFSGCLIATTAVFLVGTRTDILSTYRANQLNALYDGVPYDNEVLRDQAWRRLNALAEQTDGRIGPSPRRPSDDEMQRLWFEDPSTLNVLVIGNSHSRDVYNALDIAAQDIPGLAVARFGMLSLFPQDQRDALLASPNFAAADVVMIATRYNRDDLEAPLNVLIDDLEGHGRTIVLVDNTAEFQPIGRMPLFDYSVRGGALVGGLETLNTFAFEHVARDVLPLNARLQDLAEDRGIIFLSRFALLCSDAQEACMLRLPDGDKALFDNHHLTENGATYVAGQIVATGWLAPVIEAACMMRTDGPCAR